MKHSVALAGLCVFIILNGLAAHARDFLNLQEAQAVFDELPGNLTKDANTKCGDRAHVWSYLLKKNYGIDSKKVFLYFTPKSFDHSGMGWGVHVATLVQIGGDEYIIEKIPNIRLDHWEKMNPAPRLFSGPVPYSAWLKQLTGFDSCKTVDIHQPQDHEVIKKAFNSVFQYKSDDDCLIAKTPSGFWWPASVHYAVSNNDFFEEDIVDADEAKIACLNTHSGSRSSAKAACTGLLGL